MKARLFSALAAGFLFFQLGYGFENGDQLQYLLLPYRSIYPHFLPGDWFTWHTSHYHETYSWLVRALHAISGEAAFPYAMLLMQLVVLMTLCFSILRLAEALGYSWACAAIAVLVLGCVRETGIAGSTLNHGRLLPADLALPPFLFACAAWARGQKSWVVGAWLGLAGFFHANFAVLGPLVLGPLVLEQSLRDKRVSQMLPMIAAYALIASPTLALIAGSFMTSDRAPAEIAITLFIRSPHHYELASIDTTDFCWALLLLLAGLPSWMTMRASERPARARLLAATSAVVAIGILGAALRSIALARLFAWRMSVPMLLLLLFAFAETAQVFWRQRAQRGPAALLWLAACVAWIATFARQDLSLVAPHLSERALWPIAAGGLALLAPFLAARGRTVIVASCALVSLLCFAQVALIPLTPLSSGRSKKPETARGLHMLDGRINLFPPQRALLEKIRTDTPPGARFLIPPGMIEFRMLARRSVFVDWKCAPMKGDEALEWQRRMLAAMGTADFPARSYKLRREADRVYLARPIEELVALARQERLTHIVTARPAWNRFPAGLGLRRLFNNKDYIVYSLAKE